MVVSKENKENCQLLRKNIPEERISSRFDPSQQIKYRIDRNSTKTFKPFKNYNIELATKVKLLHCYVFLLFWTTLNEAKEPWILRQVSIHKNL